MEADIYPRQCVTGSAKSAMMNVLAGINPQCTPPPPSSSAVPPPPAATTSLDSPRTPLRHLSRPLTIRSHTLSKRISLLHDFIVVPLLSLFPFLFTLFYMHLHIAATTTEGSRYCTFYNGVMIKLLESRAFLHHYVTQLSFNSLFIRFLITDKIFF